MEEAVYAQFNLRLLRARFFCCRSGPIWAPVALTFHSVPFSLFLNLHIVRIRQDATDARVCPLSRKTLLTNNALFFFFCVVYALVQQRASRAHVFVALIWSTLRKRFVYVEFKKRRFVSAPTTTMENGVASGWYSQQPQLLMMMTRSDAVVQSYTQLHTAVRHNPVQNTTLPYYSLCRVYAASRHVVVVLATASSSTLLFSACTAVVSVATVASANSGNNDFHYKIMCTSHCCRENAFSV